MFLFVYGTLKFGYHNNHYLQDEEFVREAQTKPYYRLFSNDYFPMMIEDRDGYSVTGEIWEVDEDRIDEIDQHEMLYTRRLIKVKGFKEEVWAYIYRYSLRNLRECYGIWP